MESKKIHLLFPMLSVVTKSPRQILVATAVCVTCVAFWFVFNGETIRVYGYTDKYVQVYRKFSPSGWLAYGVAVHGGDSRYRSIRFGAYEWDNPTWCIVPYWRDPADGAILFATNTPETDVADVYLLMPSGRPQYHARVFYTDLLDFGGGDLGVGDRKMAVKRLGPQKFEISLREGEPVSIVVELALWRK